MCVCGPPPPLATQVQPWSLLCWMDHTCQKLTTQWCMWVELLSCPISFGCVYVCTYSTNGQCSLTSFLQSLDEVMPELNDTFQVEVTIIAQVSGLRWWQYGVLWMCRPTGCCWWMVWPLSPPSPSPSILLGCAASCCACSGEGSVTEVFQHCIRIIATTLPPRQVYRGQWWYVNVCGVRVSATEVCGTCVNCASIQTELLSARTSVDWLTISKRGMILVSGTEP